RRQVLCDAAPALALVARREQRAAGCAEIDACGLEPVGCHCLSQHTEEGVFLRQSLAQVFPSATAIAGAPDGGLGVRHEAAVNVTVERQQVERLALAGMDGCREAEGGGKPLLYALPSPATVLAAVHAAVVLLVEKVAAPGRLY